MPTIARTRISTITSGQTPAEKDSLAYAASIIRHGGLVVFPTETVYGLGCDGTNADSVRAVYEAKGRPADNPLILHVADPADAAAYAYTSPLYDRLAERFMPGPLTVIMPVRDVVPGIVTAGLDTVAIRCPEHPVARLFISECETAIAAPSANLSGRPSPTCVEHAVADMFGRVDMIIDGGPCRVGVESTIVRIVSEDELLLLRPGGVTVEMLKKVCPNVTLSPAVTAELPADQKVESPGMKYKHYAPKQPLILLDGALLPAMKYIAARRAPCSVLAYEEEKAYFRRIPCVRHIYSLGRRSDLSDQCRRLFLLLREADTSDVSCIYAPLPPQTGLGLALYNRMIRAAAHTIVSVGEV